MPQPPAYARTFSFTEDEAAHPNDHTPGVSLDAEFDGIGETLAAILRNLLKIQRDDGALKNAIVTLDSLSPAVILALGADGWEPRGAWAAATDYAIGDIVTAGTATVVCAVAHLSAATYAEEAAGVWIRLFDEAGGLADGEVTADKIAPGAVTAEAVGFNSLDLTGSLRGQGGVTAGTAPPGSLLHAKKDAGDVFGKIERAADDQGAVGYQIVGVGATWTLEQADEATDLQLRVGANVRVTYGSDGVISVPGAIRVVAGANPTAGAGAHLSYVASVGYVIARDYTANAWKDLKLQGAAVYISPEGVDIAKATSTGLDILPGKTLTLNGAALGYLGIPQNQKNGAYTLTLTDVGQHVYSQNTGAQIVTVPPKDTGTANWSTDTTILIINDGTSPITLTQGAGVSIRLAGSASVGNRTIGAGGMCFLKYVSLNRWFASGPGVS